MPSARRRGCLAALAVLVGAASVGLNIGWLVGMAGEGVSSPLAAYALRLGKIASVFAMLAIVGFAWILFRELLGHGAEAEA